MGDVLDVNEESRMLYQQNFIAQIIAWFYKTVWARNLAGWHL
jgi:hypothetical protein